MKSNSPWLNNFKFGKKKVQFDLPEEKEAKKAKKESVRLKSPPLLDELEEEPPTPQNSPRNN